MKTSVTSIVYAALTRDAYSNGRPSFTIQGQTAEYDKDELALLEDCLRDYDLCIQERYRHYMLISRIKRLALVVAIVAFVAM